jgi:hypothetical protein
MSHCSNLAVHALTCRHKWTRVVYVGCVAHEANLLVQDVLKIKTPGDVQAQCRKVRHRHGRR